MSGRHHGRLTASPIESALSLGLTRQRNLPVEEVVKSSHELRDSVTVAVYECLVGFSHQRSRRWVSIEDQE